VNIGDMIEADTGHIGLILDREMLYPGHPCSPVRNYIVVWNEEAPRYAALISGNKKITKLSSFAVKRKINESW
jgi:hypothetical protein